MGSGIIIDYWPGKRIFDIYWNEAIKDKTQVNLIINNRAGGNAPLIAQKITDRFHSRKQQKLL